MPTPMRKPTRTRWVWGWAWTILNKSTHSVSQLAVGKADTRCPMSVSPV